MNLNTRPIREQLEPYIAVELSARSRNTSFFYAIAILFIIVVTYNSKMLAEETFLQVQLYTVLLISIAAAIYRTRLCHSFSEKDSDREQWLIRFSISTLLLVVCWSYTNTAIYYYTQVSISEPTVLISTTTMTAVSAGGVVALSPHARLLTTFLVILYIPALLVTLLFFNPIIIAMLAIYGLFLYSLSAQINRQFNNSISNLLMLETLHDEARQASKSKSDFLAKMSHEIRTPMNGVIGVADLLMDTPLNDEQKNYTRTIQASANVLMVVINDILDFSRMEAGKMQLKSSDFQFGQLLENCKAILDKSLREKQLNFVIEHDASIPETLSGDCVRLEQVLLNLLNNAIKFTEQGQISLTTRLLDNNGPDCQVQFVVEDSGIGMDAATIERLFQSFSQADSSIQRRYGGTGLGLAISKQLIEMMGGQISVQSVPGKGSSFTFNVTLKAVSASEKANETQVDSSRPERALEHSILLVDDNKVNLKVANAMLRKLGFQHIDNVENGQQAVEQFQKKKFDLILMDCEMPVMDGFQATREIRDIEKQQNQQPIPIIALTAHVLPEFLEKARSSGMNDSLAKPVKKEAIKNCLANYLSM